MIDVLQAAPETVILAEDEAGLYLQATLSRVWAPQGQTPLVRSDPNRAKTNFYGSLNLHTGQEIAMSAPSMNAACTAQHLQQVLAAIPDRPLLLLWDRAPWHRGPPIRQVLADNPRLEIMLFPVAALELNLLGALHLYGHNIHIRQVSLPGKVAEVRLQPPDRRGTTDCRGTAPSNCTHN